MNLYEQISANRKRTFWLFLSFLMVIIGFGYFLSVYYGSPSILYIAVIFSTVMSWISYYHSDKMVIKSNNARPLDNDNPEEKEIERMVENLAITAGMDEPPDVYIVDESAPNAFATGRNPENSAIGVTKGLIRILEDDEMEGVLAHEMSHIKNYDILVGTIAVTLVGIVVLAADWFLRMQFYGGKKAGTKWMALIGIIFAILAPIFVNLLHMAISRKREYLADASGAMLTRYPEGLAKALIKISQTPSKLDVNRATAHLYFVNPLAKAGEVWKEVSSTHPPVKERVEALLGREVEDFEQLGL